MSFFFFVCFFLNVMCVSEGKKKKVKNTAGLKKEVKIFSEQEFDYKNDGYCCVKKKTY